MKYTAQQRTVERKPQPTSGWHTMKIVREMVNKKSDALHTFILETETTALFWNVFLKELDDLALAAGVSLPPNGELDTSKFVGKFISVEVGEKFSKEGKSFMTVLEFVSAQPQAKVANGNVDTSDIPF